MGYEIIPADERRMAEVEAWLDEEEAEYSAESERWESNGYVGAAPARGFRCNWDTVKRTWREGNANVYILVVDGYAVGFLDGTDILEIKPDLRRNGYGRLLADFMVNTVYEEGRSVVEIEIAPASAKPFWKRMGFKLVHDRSGPGGGIYAYKILPRTFDLSHGERVPFSVCFFTEEAGYSSDPKPFRHFDGQGERLPDGAVQLPQRAFCFDPSIAQKGDYFVRIGLDGREIIFDKAKREECTNIGMKRDRGGIFYIEKISAI